MGTQARGAGLRLLVGALAVLGCGGEGGRELEWQYGFAPGVDPDRAAFVRARILEGGCSGVTLYEEQLAAGVPPGGKLPPELTAGVYGFSVEARDETCATFAAGCAEARVPDDRRVTVTVASVAESAACLPADCQTGRCPGPDASVCMPTTEVCNGVDDDCDAAVDEDFDLETDLANCGECGNACSVPNASTECAGATCTGAILACDEGFEDCDGDASTGCEVDLRTLSDCGACGIACGPFPNASATCGDGTCALDACDTGFESCDGDASTGCETDVRTLTDCGACGAVCGPLPNATATCAGGTCEIEACDMGWGDCDVDPSNGCEIDLTDDEESCGSCGNRCPGSRICCAGVCETGCSGGVCCAP